jgi:hypothetical protein
LYVENGQLRCIHTEDKVKYAGWFSDEGEDVNDASYDEPSEDSGVNILDSEDQDNQRVRVCD